VSTKRRALSILALILAAPVCFWGCAAKVEPRFEDSNHYFIEQTVAELDVAGTVGRAIPEGSSISVASMEDPTNPDPRDTASTSGTRTS